MDLTFAYRVAPDPDRWWPVPAAGAAGRTEVETALAALLADAAGLLARADDLARSGEVLVAVGLPTVRPLLALVDVAAARAPDHDYLLELAEGVADDAFGRPGVGYLDGPTGDGVHVLRHDLVDGVMIASRILAVRREPVDVVVACRSADVASVAVAGGDLQHLLASVVLVGEVVA